VSDGLLLRAVQAARPDPPFPVQGLSPLPPAAGALCAGAVPGTVPGAGGGAVRAGGPSAAPAAVADGQQRDRPAAASSTAAARAGPGRAGRYRQFVPPAATADAAGAAASGAPGPDRVVPSGTCAGGPRRLGARGAITSGLRGRPLAAQAGRVAADGNGVFNRRRRLL
jgi:hypothetical protein